MKTKRITINVTAAAKQSAQQASATLEEVFQDCRSLTGKERRRLYKLGRGTQAFVTQMHALSRSHLELLPRSFDLPQVEADLELLEYMETMAMQLRILLERVEHSAMLLGSDVLAEMVSAYNILQENGEEAGISEVLREVGKRFAKKKRKSDPEPAAEASLVQAESLKEQPAAVEQVPPHTPAVSAASHRSPGNETGSGKAVRTSQPIQRGPQAHRPYHRPAGSMASIRGELPDSAFHGTRSPGDPTSAAEPLRHHGS